MHSGRRRLRITALVVMSLFFFASATKAFSATWQGVDESVIEKIAAENGRKPWRPLIDTDQGDLLLFAFLLAGATGGFLLGICWRKIFYEK